MYHADRIGLARIRDRLAEMARRSNDDTLEPAPLLIRLAASGGGFSAT
jgi:3-hydroxyacyl-CoA dehydrogenase